MICSFRKNNGQESMECVFVAEFAFNEDIVMIATDEEYVLSIDDILLMESSIGHYPPVMIRYNGHRYGVQIIPSEDFIGKHPAGRAKFVRKGQDVATRTVFFELPNRGCVSIYSPGGKRYKDSPTFNKECIDICIGFIYFAINDIEAYYNGTIDRAEFEYRVNSGYNELSQSEKEYWAIMASKVGSDKD